MIFWNMKSYNQARKSIQMSGSYTEIMPKQILLAVEIKITTRATLTSPHMQAHRQLLYRADVNKRNKNRW